MNIIDSIEVSARLENLYKCVELVSSCAEKHGFAKSVVNKIELATEEAVVNIFHYAYRGCEGDVEISCMTGNEDLFLIEITDSGIPFNILNAPEPHFSADTDIPRHGIGGLGIFMIKSLMDEIKYRREAGKNILTLAVSKKNKRD
jgi:anti-sigma regulatory factor (Ser/Thr protein kinase)